MCFVIVRAWRILLSVAARSLGPAGQNQATVCVAQLHNFLNTFLSYFVQDSADDVPA